VLHIPKGINEPLTTSCTMIKATPIKKFSMQF
jgi:hypothetical protein